MKRVFLFLSTNLAVIVLLSITAQVLGVNRWLTANGLNLGGLLVFASLFGFGGAFISLAMSKWMAKRSTGAVVIENPRDPAERWLVETVRRQAERAGIGMPEVAIYDAPEINAFATGMNRNEALVAVSTGLLRNMSRDEAEAVLGHEVSHVANGDMVTLTLIQGVVNTFVIFLSRIVGYVVDRVILKNERGYGIGFFVATMVSEVVLGLLASIIVMWFSRQREFRADAGGAGLAGRDKMIAALERLKQIHEPSTLPEGMQAFGIAGGLGGGLKVLMMSHPPLEQRIAALRSAATTG
ncbi:MAG: protease HtpX [Betaproteobacteria bacterium]|nr:protease HtpX [Betaproteobacteria bacterium]